MAVYARRLIEQLNEGDGGTVDAMEAGPLFEIEDVRDEPGGLEFETGLSDEVAMNGRPTSAGSSAIYPVWTASTKSSGRTGADPRAGTIVERRRARVVARAAPHMPGI